MNISGQSYIIYDDGDLIAADKPPGLLIHNSSIDRECTESFTQIVSREAGLDLKLINRLDKPTSGLVLFCRSENLARAMGNLFAGNHPEKIYFALCRGWPSDEGSIDYPLRTIVDSRGKKVVSGESKQAVTRWNVINRFELPYPDRRFETSRISLCRIIPQTGRYHQIRRHFKHISHQIIGDTTHGDGFYNRIFREKLDISRLMLHSLSISFVHPFSTKIIEISSTLPHEFTVKIQEFISDAYSEPS